MNPLNLVICLAVAGAVLWGGAFLPAFAQDAGDGTPAGPSMGPPVPPFDDSLLFSPLEVNAVRDAVEKGRVRDVVRQEDVPDVPAVRYLRVSGVTFRSEADWVVWLNGRQLTPDALLPEIIDIKVRKDKVHLTWFDKATGRTVVVVLRPNQTYDILSGLLLPG